MTSLDYAVMLIYLLVIVLIGIWSARRTGSPDELFLAGRSFGFGVIGLSLYASNISSTTLVGLAGAAYGSGIAVVNYEWMAAVILVFAAFVLVPQYLRHGRRTVPEYVGDALGPFARRYVAGIMIVLSIFVDTAGSLFAGAIVIKFFFPAWELLPIVMALTVFAGAYTIVGGLRAVMLTDVVQALVLILSAVVIAFGVYREFDFSLERMVAALPAERLSVIRPSDDPDMPWTGLLTGVPILGLYYWSMNHYIAQRFFAARDLRAAQRGALLGAALKLTPLFLMVLPGALAIVLLPDLQRADEVFPALIANFLPDGLRGLAVVGVMAAIMSTVDSTINASAAMISYDFMGIDRAVQETPRTLVTRSRWTTAVLLIVAMVWAPAIESFPGLFSYLQQMFAIAVPPVVAAVLTITMMRGYRREVVVIAMLGGHLAALGFAAAAASGLWHWHFLETAGLVFAIACVPMVSLRSSGRTALPSDGSLAVPIDRVSVIASMIVLSLVAATVWAFR